MSTSILVDDRRASSEMLAWVRSRIRLPGFTSNSWTEEHDMVCSDFLLNENITKLIIYVDKDIGLCMHTLNVAPLSKVKKLQYFLKSENLSNLVVDDLPDSIQYGIMTGGAMESLLKMMNSVYLPTFLTNESWPESVKKEFSGQLHKFMASLTETANQVKGHTVLYLPDENLTDVEAAATDKDLVQRLESTLIHWTRQIKEVVSNQETSHHIDHSGPLEEIEFWRSRTLDLSGIRKQLDRPGVRDIVGVLKLANSSYLKPFETLSDMIAKGSEEANDNLKFLSTLQGPCERLSKASPDEVPGILPEVLNLIRMIWTISEHYNTSERITGLLRKVSNQIIQQCRLKISLREIFDGDVVASMKELQASILCADAWHRIYDKTTEAIARDSTVGEWDFDPSTHGIFAQIDAFAQRCHNLMEVCEGQLQFARKGAILADGKRAELPAFGGSRGAEIEKSLYEIEEAFDKHIDKLRKLRLEYDILNVKATNWHYDYNQFKQGLKDLEVMMTNVISSAWEGVSTVAAGAELLQAFSTLAVRQAMKTSVERKSGELCKLFLGELKKVKSDFDRNKKTPPLPPGQPHYAGTALWTRGLLARVESEWKVLDSAEWLVRTPEADEAEAAYKSLVSVLIGWIRQMHTEWSEGIMAAQAAAQEGHQPSFQDRLNVHLMVRAQPTHARARASRLHLEGNFDKTLLRLFAEVRYWETFNGEYAIPYVAQQMYQQHERLRVTRESVMLVVRDYNTILDALTPEQRRLFYEHLRRVDRKISPGLGKLTWAGKHIKGWYVLEARRKCAEVYDIVLNFQRNNARIERNCAKMAASVLVDLEKNVVYDDTVFQKKQIAHQERIRKDLRAAYEDILTTMKASFEFFVDNPKEIQREWYKYIRKTDQKMETALRHTVKHSLQELARAINGDAKNEAPALFRVNMVLNDEKGQVEFRPTMNNLKDMIHEMSRSAVKTIQAVPRLADVLLAQRTENEVKFQVEAATDPSDATAAAAAAAQNGINSFYDVIVRDDDIIKITHNIVHGTDNVEVDLKKIVSHYDRYQPIWNQDKAAFIRRYEKTKRPLASFDMDINRYKDHQQDIQSEEQSHNVHFIRVDCLLLKQSLKNHCQQWQQKLTNLLHNNATTDLNALHELFSSNTARLSKPPENLQMLAEGIDLQQKLQSELPQVEARFEPLEETYKTLDKFDVHVADEEKELMDQLRVTWISFQQALVDADKMLKLRKVDMRKELEDNLVSYNAHMQDTRTEFKDHAPFSAPHPEQGEPNIEAAFGFIKDFRKRIADNRLRAEQLKKGMEIFGIEQPEHKEMDDTEKELNMLEKVWLMMREWREKWESWKAGKFSDLVVKDLDTAAATFQKNMGKMGRGVKQWKAWKALFAIIQRFRNTMPLISDLRSPAMRPRHWQQLREEIQKEFDPNGEDFTLAKLFELGLHNHSDAVSSLASVAQRELNIETSLEEIDEVWTSSVLDLVEYKSKYYKVRAVVDINDALENHQLSLSAMKNSPYYPSFSDQINKWDRCLNDVAETIEMLMGVQRQWMYLESIFMDSADIRKQLPKESTMFEKTNGQWVVLMQRLVDGGSKTLDITQGGLLATLGEMNETLEQIQKSLDAYLESKRQLFPRFYFLSNDDLLEILGQSKDPVAVQKHISKCFMGIQLLLLEDVQHKNGRSGHLIVGFQAADGEQVKLVTPVPVEGEVESWLVHIEKSMMETLQKLLFLAFQHVEKATNKKAAMDTWIKSTIGQLLLLSGQISWTSKCRGALMDMAKNKRAMRRLKNEWYDYVKKLGMYVRGSLTAVERLKVVALITIEVHNRDVIDLLKASSKLKAGINAFQWISQLRFYFEKGSGEFGRCVVRQTNTQFNYGYEYQGNNGRLVITPLTDRCYMTLTTALHLCRGGSPQGPAGTGKTETVKDLGKGFGMYVVVFNCSPKMTVESLGRNFSGLAQTGGWGCYDEFNRIKIEVLSVLSVQISSILDAIKAKSDTFHFAGRDINLNPTVGFFITMNPGYAGRTELPDNLSMLFRPVSMMQPDLRLIAEITLVSEGFKEAQTLSLKIVTIYDLMTQQLSKQPHYAYGLRAIKSTLRRAGELNRRKDNALSEELVLMQALTDMNKSKLVPDDVFLFDALLSDLFLNMELPKMDYGALKEEIVLCLKKNNLQICEDLIQKIVMLFATKGTRHGNMLVGDTMAGKSVTWKILAEALSSLKEKGIAPFENVEYYILNPKSVTSDQLFGAFMEDTGEWCDGILSALMRRACASPTATEKWLILDGPVDTLWIESMNTVLDDNKVLTLVNQDRISLPPQVSLLFEVEDLSQASPATTSRCGMVYLSEACVGWRPFVTSWLNAKLIDAENGVYAGSNDEDGVKAAAMAGETTTNISKEAVELLTKLFDKYAAPMLQFKETDAQCTELIPIRPFNAIQSLTRLFDSLATLENGVDPTDEGHYLRMIEMWFTFCCVWSIGGSLTSTSRQRLDTYVRELEAQFPPLQTCYEYYVEPGKKDWALWEDKVNTAWRPAPNVPFSRLMVPTVDTVRYRFVLCALMKNKHPVLVTGNTGTSKTSIMQAILDDVETSVIPSSLAMTMNFSAATTAGSTQELLESRLEKRQRTNYGPLGARARLVAFVDDLNMPTKDEFGSQPPIELLRQFMDYGFWYEQEKQTKKTIMDVMIVAAMGPPGGARSEISRRMQSKFHLINFTFPQDAQVQRIFRTLIAFHFSEFDESVKPLAPILTQATLEMYQTMSEQFLPTPSCCHYLFNMRDMSKLVQGILQSEPKQFDTKESMIRLWVHEGMRVFYDRLVSNHDREHYLELVNIKLQSAFDTNWESLFTAADVIPLFVNFLEDETPAVIGDDSEDIPPYQEVTHKRDKVKAFLQEKLEVYNLDPETVSQDLVLFNYALEHLTRIYRIIKQPRGAAMLVGMGGSGRQSLTRLAAHVANYNLIAIEPSNNNYRLEDFREDLKEVYRQSGVEQEPTVLLLSDTNIKSEAMLEDVNSMLNSGEIPKLFPPDELMPILEEMRQDATKRNLPTSQDSLYALFIERARDNMHIVLCMSPVGAEFRNRVRMFPALVNNTTIDWFSAWPRAALEEVASRFLAPVDTGENAKVKQNLASLFGLVHETTQEQSERMKVELKRINYITPTKYLDLVEGYILVLNNQRSKLKTVTDKLQSGLTKLDESSTQVADMAVVLEEKKKIVAQKKVACEKLVVEILQKQRAADEQKKQVELDAKRTEEEARECMAIKTEAETELSKALPALQAAQKALDKLTNSAVSEVKTYKNPPKQVEKVLCAIMVVLQKEVSWNSAKKEMGDPRFLERLKTYDKDNMSNSVLKSVGKYTKDKSFNAADVTKKSAAAGAMCAWVIAMELYARVFRDVEPRRMALAKAQSTLAKKEAQLQTAREQLAEVTAKVAKLQKGLKDSEDEAQALTAEAERLEQNLERASQLVVGLGGEHTRWSAQVKQLTLDATYLVGDCALAAAFLSYAGPMPSDYRTLLVEKTWVPATRKLNLPCSPTFDLIGFLAEPSNLLHWGIQGLPSDAFSVQNAILVVNGPRWPLMIDPQGQANMWIKNKEPELQVCDFRTEGFLRIIQNAVQNGLPMLIEDVGEQLDPAVEPLLRLSVNEGKTGMTKTIMLGDKEFTYNPNFSLFLTTKLANPHYKPGVSAKTTCINFAVVERGLQDQLLAIVVKLEQPELEQEKVELVKTVSGHKLKLVELEDKILGLMNSAGDNLLEETDLIIALQESKLISEEVKASLAVSQETEIKIDEAREGYRPVAVRAAICFFVLNDLAKVAPMYQFSLSGYVDLFKTSIDDSRTANNTDQEPDHQERMKTLNDYHTLATYEYACRALFEKHKLLFAFQLCAQILAKEGKIDPEEYSLFLRGGQVLDHSNVPPNPVPEWLNDAAWDSITVLDQLPNFKGLAHSFEQYSSDWADWYSSEDPPPERLALPGEWQSKRDEFQSMLVLRCLRPDRVVYAARSYITNNLGARFTQSPAFDLPSIYTNANHYTPLIFVLSSGVDPTPMLKQFAVSRGAQLDMLALGQGQVPIAEKLIERGCVEGNWVFLANVHLSTDWLPRLDKLVERLALQKPPPHENFRLWLSSNPSDQFPISLLQRAVKMTTEPPRGLRANMLRLYSNIDQDRFNRCGRPEKYKKLLFSLSFFHSVLIERKKFLSLGWNVPYKFNDSDFEFSEDILALYLDEYDETPWDALKYLIAETVYGGRVTDKNDRKLLHVYINQYFSDAAITTANYALSSLDTYYIPDDSPTTESYIKYIRTMPDAGGDPPEAFGQHANADIASQMEETKTLLGTILSLQPDKVEKGAKTREETVLELVTQLKEQMPKPLDLVAIQRAHELDRSPLTTVLLQEIGRYNVLLGVVHKSLVNLEMGIKGLVVISPELEVMFEALYNAQVPPMWLFAYPSLKPLGPWTRELDQRIAQLTKWAAEGAPKVFWLTGFTFPTGFLTALLQLYARNNSLSIDNLAWDFVVMASNEQAINVAPKDGAYVKGLFLEGARWDVENVCLTEPLPMELYCQMPIVHFKPVEHKKKGGKGLHACPLYIYPIRTGTRERPSWVIDVDLKSGPRDSHFWTKRGSALLLSLDH